MFNLNSDHKRSLEIYAELLKEAEQERLARQIEKASYHGSSSHRWDWLKNIFGARRQGYAAHPSQTSRIHP